MNFGLVRFICKLCMNLDFLSIWQCVKTEAPGSKGTEACPLTNHFASGKQHTPILLCYVYHNLKICKPIRFWQW